MHFTSRLVLRAIAMNALCFSDHLIKIIASGIPITTTATNHESSKRKYDKKIALLALLLQHNNNVIVCFIDMLSCCLKTEKKQKIVFNCVKKHDENCAT